MKYNISLKRLTFVCRSELQNFHVVLRIEILLLFYHFCAGYLQLCNWNKLCLYGIEYCSCSVFTICDTCNVISHIKYILYFYFSTFQSTRMRAVPNTAVFCSSLISCFPIMLLRYCQNDFAKVPIFPIITGVLLLLLLLLLFIFSFSILTRFGVMASPRCFAITVIGHTTFGRTPLGAWSS